MGIICFYQGVKQTICWVAPPAERAHNADKTILTPYAVPCTNVLHGVFGDGLMTTHTHPELHVAILEHSKAFTAEIGATEGRLRADMQRMEDRLSLRIDSLDSRMASMQSDIGGLQVDIGGLQEDMRRVITWIESQGGR